MARFFEQHLSGQGNTEPDSDVGVDATMPHATGATRLRKRSLHLTLVFISAAALAGCGRIENNESVRRDVYANLDACRADWGNPEDCEEIDEKRSASGSRSYYGPRYASRTGHSSGYSSTIRPGSRASGTVAQSNRSSSASRGGFGSSGSSRGGSASG